MTKRQKLRLQLSHKNTKNTKILYENTLAELTLTVTVHQQVSCHLWHQENF